MLPPRAETGETSLGAKAGCGRDLAGAAGVAAFQAACLHHWKVGPAVDKEIKPPPAAQTLNWEGPGIPNSFLPLTDKETEAHGGG